MSTPPVPENPRLKALGLTLLLAAIGIVGLAAVRADEHWPPAQGELMLLLLALLTGMNLGALGLMCISAGLGSSRSWRDRRRRRALVLRWLIANALAPVLVVGFLVDDSEGRRLVSEATEAVLVVVVYGVLLVLWRLWRRSQRHEAPSADEAMMADPRPPVLYLRSFKDDGLSLTADVRWQPLRRLYGALEMTTPEQHCADELEALGPVIAIGKPGEPLPELGAARLYVGHEIWQQEVMRLMRLASLVVVRVGASPGVLWEIEQALALLPRERLVFARFGAGEVAPEIAQRLQPVLGRAWAQALPPQRGPLWKELLFGSESQRQVGALVCFPTGSAAANVVEVRWGRGLLGGLRVLGFARLGNPLRAAWRDVFDRLGLAVARRPPSRLTAIMLALAIGWTGAHWFYLGRRRRGWCFVAGLPVLAIGMLVAWVDAVRFVSVDRRTFEREFVAPQRLA